jgi:hypothetical protein
LTLSGTAIRIGALGGFNDEPNVNISFRDGVGGSPVTTTTSDSGGSFALPVPTAGRPISPVVTFEKANVMTSVLVHDEPINHDVAMIAGYMGTTSAVDNLYLVAGLGGQRSSARGTLLMMATDCAGAVVAGVTLAVDPPPARIRYSGTNGLPDGGLAATSGPFGFAWAFNVGPGPVTITASKPGDAFLPQTVEVLAGDIFTGTMVRPMQ